MKRLPSYLFIALTGTLSVLSAIVLAQQNPTATQAGAGTTVTGRVTRTGSGTPIGGATVTLTAIPSAEASAPARGPNGANRGANRGGVGGGAFGLAGGRAGGAATANPSGRTEISGFYTLTGVPPGQYRGSVSAPGFVTQEFGQLSADLPGTPITVAANGETAVSFQLTPGGAVEGVVFDEDDMPLPDSRVQLFTASYDTGQLILVPNRTAQTNVIGEYRISGLDPGDYYLAASASAAQSILPPDTAIPQSATPKPVPAGARGGRGGRGAADQTPPRDPNAPPLRAYPSMFFPGSTNVREAAMLHLGAGTEARATNVTLKPVPLATVRGSIIVPAVAPPAQTQPDGAQQPGARGGPRQGAAPGRGAPGPVAQGPGRGGAPARGGVRGGALGGPANPSAGVTIQLIPVGIGAGRGAAPGGERSITDDGAIVIALPARGGPRGAAGGTEVSSVTTRDDGTFQIDNVLPGSYFLFASTRVNNVALTGSGRLDVVFSSVDNFTLTLRQGFTLRGNVQLNGQSPQNYRAESVELSLTNADNIPVTTSKGRTDSTGQIALDDVAPGRYRVTATPPAGAYVEKILYGGVDALNEPIQLDAADAPIEILLGFTEGRIEAVAEKAGSAFPNARVLLAPAARSRLDLFKTASADREGRVVFSNVPPGTYKLFAWESLTRANAYRNPQFLEPLESRGRPIVVEKSGVAFEGHVEVLPAQ